MILKEIYQKYIIGIPFIRLLIGPTLMCMLFARYLEVKLGEIIQRVSIHIDIPFSRSCSTLVWKYFIVSSVSCLLIEFQGFIFTAPIQRAFREASKNSFFNLINLDYSEFTKLGIGEVHANIERKSQAVSEILDVLILNFLPVTFVLLFSSYKIYLIIGLVPAIILNVTLFLYAFTTIKIATWRNRIRKDVNRAINDASNCLYDTLTNYDCVIAYNNEELETERYDKCLRKTEKHSVKLWRSFYFLNFLQRLIFGMQTGGIIFFGVNGYFMNKIKSDQFVLYLSISRILASNLDKLGYMYARFTQAMTNAKMTYIPPKPVRKEYSITEFSNTIEYKDVSFSYNGHFIFENVNFKVNYGEKVAIIGRNGVGKSTMLKLLLKFNQYSGKILIDGNNLQYISKKSIRNIISYVPQEGLMINESIKFNLRYGNPHIDDYQMINICNRMGVNESIIKLENGYNTLVGPRGSHLSGGEKQKICLMRALFKDSDILIMDEPTANVDIEAESNLIRNTFKQFNEKTVLMIVHNHSILKYFDRILKLDSNGISEVSLEDISI